MREFVRESSHLSQAHERERSDRHLLPPLPRRNLVIRSGTGQKLPSSVFLVKDTVSEGYVKYGMKVFEYEHAEK